MNMMQALSKYLRLWSSKGSEIVTVEDELEMCEELCADMPHGRSVMKICLPIRIDCEVDPEETWVLKLIFAEPLVENSIKYGFCEIYEGGQIRSHVYKQDGRLMWYRL